MTEEPEQNIQNIEEEKALKIYSKKAIMAFAILFTTIFAGVLLRQNLVDIKNKKAANIVLAFSIIYTILSILIINLAGVQNRSLTFILNIIGGAILTEYFFRKHFPDENYEYKKIWKPLIISLLIISPFVLIMILSM